MNFANPAALWWALLAAPIVVFYILKIRLRREPVSTIIFWRQIFHEKQPRSIWQHLRHLTSLALQLAFLALLVGALVKPLLNWQTKNARHLVLVVDNSASMNATDVSPSRLEEARRLGYQAISGLGEADEMAIVAAGGQPRVVCGLTGHQRTLRRALESITASDAPTHVDEGVEIGLRLLAEADNREVIVLSDAGFSDAEKLREAHDVRLVSIGGKASNIGITRFQVRRSLADPVGFQILAEVQNYSPERTECRLEVTLGEDVVDVLPLKLEPGERWARVLDQQSAEGGTVLAKLTQDDALAADNEAWAVLPHTRRQQVLLVTPGNLFLQKVLEAIPLVELSVSKTAPDTLSDGAILILHKTLPAKLPAGRIIVIDPASGCDLWQDGDKLQNPIVVDQDRDSPLMAHLRLDNVVFPEARKLVFSEPPKILAKALEGDALYAAVTRPAGDVLVLSANLDEGDLPLRTAFPIMISNALNWFRGSQGELREALAAGTTTKIELPPAWRVSRGEPAAPDANATEVQSAAKTSALTPVVLRSPTGETQTLQARDGAVTIGPLDQRGVWTLAPAPAETSTTAGTATTKATAVEPLEIACNVACAEESDLAPRLSEEAQTASLAGRFGGQPLWLYLLLAAIALTSTEWFLYQRRWIS